MHSWRWPNMRLRDIRTGTHMLYGSIATPRVYQGIAYFLYVPLGYCTLTEVGGSGTVGVLPPPPELVLKPVVENETSST